MSSVTALLYGSDRPGIVARVAGWIHERGSNVLHADQHLDRQQNVFFQRVEWETASSVNALDEGVAFQQMAESELGMNVRIGYENDRPKIGIMVSKADHCFHDLALRVRSGEWNAEIAGVLSNHQDLRNISESYDLSFQYNSLSRENKENVESKQIEWIKNRKWNFSFLPVICRF